LMPQLVAATHPITFMGLPGSWSVIQLCLSFESTGVAHFAWVLASMLRCVFAMGEKENIKAPNSEKFQNSRNKDHRSVPIEEKRNEGNLKYDEFDIAMLKKNMNISDVMDSEKLFACAEDGLSNASSSALNSRETHLWLTNEIIRRNYGVGTSSNLPMPATIVRHLVDHGQPVPRYLLPPCHPQHIPPHIVCYELLRREECRRQHQGVNMDGVFGDNVDDQTQHTA